MRNLFMAIMGLRDTLAKMLASESFADDGAGERKDDAVRKQEADRRAQLSRQMGRVLEASGVLRKPYDPMELRDFAENTVAQAYIDTLAQDAATAKWSLEPRHEDADVGEQVIENGEETLKELHPELSFRDMREFTARDLLELGDATWVKHFTSGGELAEAIPVDSSRMYKRVDDHGFTEGYAQASFSAHSIEVTFDLDEVVWFTWAQGGRSNYKYGYGPTEKGMPVIELLDELSDKELKDLKEGAPPGIVTAKDSDDNPIPPEEFDRVDEQWELQEGQRHRHIISRGEWDFVPLSPGYEELQLLDRNRYWLQVLGSIYKVNPTYAGFFSEEGNMAKDVSQAEAFVQRGFRVMLRYLEEAINKQLVWPHISDDLKFTHEEARTVEEKKNRAELRQAQADAGKQLADAGLDVSYRDGELRIEDGEMESGSDPSGGGPGIFGSADANPGGHGGKNGSPDPSELAKALELDEWLLKAHREQIQPDSLEDIEKRSWSGEESVPEYVREKISEVIGRGTVFNDFDSIPGDVADEIQEIFEESLTQPQGWSLDSLVGNLKDAFPGVDKDDLETVARTESSAVLNSAREEGYQDMEQPADMVFKWEGPSDSRTTEACEELKDKTNPRHGGTPVGLNDLNRLAREMNSKHFPHLDFRGDDWVIHPNERHTFVRVVDV